MAGDGNTSFQSATRSTQRRPHEFKLSLSALASLPRRLVRPPVTSVPRRDKTLPSQIFRVVPIYDVRLQDIICHRHLPPLSLKDFEEYLLYVEEHVEDLYFLLWLLEYTHKHMLLTAASRRSSGITCGPSRPIPSASALNASYHRAQQTFLSPHLGGGYALQVPRIYLRRFSGCSSLHSSPTMPAPPPDPSEFEPLRNYVHFRIQSALDRFVRASYCSMGLGRRCTATTNAAWILILGIFTIALAKSHAHRVVAIPFLWLAIFGLVLSRIGVCAMLWSFGDLRQLRAFELERLSKDKDARPRFGTDMDSPHSPRVPPPVALGEPARRASFAQPVSSLASATPKLVVDRGRRSTCGSIPAASSSNGSSAFMAPPSRIAPRPTPERRSSRESDSFTESNNSSNPSINVSPAFYDGHSPSDENVLPFFASTTRTDRRVAFSSMRPAAPSVSSTFPPTASFIPVDEDFEDEGWFVPSRSQSAELERGHQLPGKSFDFGKLPSRRATLDYNLEPWMSAETYVPPLRTPRDHLAEPKAASACSSMIVCIRRSLSRIAFGPPHPTPSTEPGEKAPTGRRSRPPPLKLDASISTLSYTPTSTTLSTGSTSSSISKTDSARVRPDSLRRIWSVGAFSTPIVRVREPLVARAQWEIIMRTCAWATFISWAVVGIFWAVPLRS